ncbi:MAG TPA: GTPase Era [Polyangiaceae bacterium]|nr:GTPase Era [Polyangiaceae bacterium]
MSRPPLSRRTRAGRVALVGRANVGKSTLFNAIVGESLAITSAHPQTTRQIVRGVLTRDDAQFVLMDTPGLHPAKSKLGLRMNEAARAAARGADATVLLVEAPVDGRADARLEADIAAVGDLVGPSTVVAITKIDRLADKSRLLPMSSAVEQRLGTQRIVPVSARKSDGIARLLGEVRLLLPSQPFLFDEDTLTDQPARFFVAELVREQMLKHLRQEIPHGVAVVVDRFEESGKVTRIDVTVHVLREAHKKIVIGSGGSMMKAIGSAARGRIEALLSQRVHLRLWVRATPGWMEDEAMLRALGYARAEGS